MESQAVHGSVCGPFFTLLLALTSYLLNLTPDDWEVVEHHWFKLSAGTSLVAMIFVADRLGKYLKLTSQQFAGPVAFSCATFCAIAFLGFAITF